MKCKLTDQNDMTQGNTQWGVNVTHKAKRGKPELCADTVIHFYGHPLLAVLLNPLHADIKNPHLWEAKGKSVIHDGLKGGCKSLTTTKCIPLPEITTNQKVHFAILCALEVYHDAEFERWATQWLKNEDRTRAAAEAAEAAARAAWAAWAARDATWAAAREAATWAAGLPTQRLIELAEQAIREEVVWTSKRRKRE